MSLYNPPVHVNEIFNLNEYVSTLDEALSENDANTLYIRRNGIESVFVAINFINLQSFHNGLNIFDSNVSIKD